MSRSYEAIQRDLRTCREWLCNLYNNTERFHWSHQQMLDYRNEHLFETAEYKRLPQWAKYELKGVEWLLNHLMWKKLVFSYIIKGKRLTLGSDAYRKVNPGYVSKHCSQTGAYVWIEAPDKVFSQACDRGPGWIFVKAETDVGPVNVPLRVEAEQWSHDVAKAEFARRGLTVAKYTYESCTEDEYKEMMGIK